MNNEKPSQHFDPSTLDSLHADLGDGINHIISTYVDDFPNNIKSMRQGLQKQEYETVGRYAHSLKSSSANLGAMELSFLSASLEQMIRNGITEETVISAAVDDLENAFKRVQPRLIGYIR